MCGREVFAGFDERIPDTLTGDAFLVRYGGTTDPVTDVDPASDLRGAGRRRRIPSTSTERVTEWARQLRPLTERPAADARVRLGELMYQSHAQLLGVWPRLRRHRSPVRAGARGGGVGGHLRREDHRRRQRRHRRVLGRRDAGPIASPRSRAEYEARTGRAHVPVRRQLAWRCCRRRSANRFQRTRHLAPGTTTWHLALRHLALIESS